MNAPHTAAAARALAGRSLQRWSAALDAFSLHRRALIGSALARILLGATGLYFYLRDYTDRGYMWGPDGVWPWQNFTGPAAGDGFSLYNLSRSDLWFELVFHAGVLAALLFTLGWKTRFSCVAHYVFLWSLNQRNPVVLDGGDNVTAIVLVFFVFIDAGARFSLDARSAKSRPSGIDRQSVRYRIGSLLHHAGLLAVILQVCTVYLVSGMYKVQGERWQNGTALYYILRVNEFGWPGVNRLVYENATLVVAITYGTVFFQLAFTFLLFNRKWRVFAVAGGILMHAGIGVHMAGLITFSLVMIALELVIMGDDHYRRLARTWRRMRQGIPEPATAAPEIDPRPRANAAPLPQATSTGARPAPADPVLTRL
ncbi:HTTM domain-containing protein [Streptomyces sp. NPDC006512]|uniref:HTTM domain-containing protein n=1 Tax=Streptomyces sp. NPDC006512 TaxID=3154307 RepID=UPI0033AD54B3